jgi:serralysin
MPNILETSDAAGSTTTTYTLGVGQTAQGTISTPTDHDWYRVELVAGQTYTFAMIGTGVSNDINDTYLQLHNSAGAQVALNDDGGPSTSSSLTFTASTTGTYYLNAGSYNDSDAGLYGLSMAAGTRAHFDEMMGAGALLVPDVSWGAGATVTWAARTTFAGSVDASGVAAPFSQLTASEVATIRNALTYFSDVANIRFNQVNPGGTSDSATILVSNYTSTTDGAGAYAYYPGDASVGAVHGDVRINTDSVDTASQPPGSYSFFAILHELGHAMGLAHPGDYNAGPGVQITYDNAAQFLQDSQQYTVMSYFDESNTTTSFNSYPDTLMLYDILAMQQLYGVNTTTRAGNTVYGFGSNAGAVYDFAQNTDPVMSIWDAGGIDTINASGFSQAQFIDLTAGRFSSIGGMVGNVSIAYGAVIENATGGSGNDTLLGNAASNVLNGGGGTDLMRGLAGADTYVVDNVGDVIQEASGGGSDRIISSVSYTIAAGVEVESIETINQAATTALTFVGNAFSQTIVGNAGSNTLVGGGGNDVLRGLGGHDTYFVDSLSDVIQEVDGAGSDRVFTAVSYTLAAGVSVELMQTTNSIGTSAINLVGNAVSQTLVGNAGANQLVGGGGNDILQGLGGNDIYVVDSASDVVLEAVGQGSDQIIAAATYTLAAGVEVELIRTINQAATTALNLIGNTVSQTIIGNAGANTLVGGGGNDVLTGLGGNDSYFVDSQSDIINEVAGGGTADRVYTVGTFVLAADDNIEFLATTNAASTAAINLVGNALSQTITGNAGVNVIYGGLGNDTLQGLGGSDIFVFNTALGASNVDTLSDFTAADTVYLENAVFTALTGTGTLTANQFVSNTTGLATTASQRIIYESDTGNLYYDSNGSAAGGSVLFAHLTAGLVLTSADFFIF